MKHAQKQDEREFKGIFVGESNRDFHSKFYLEGMFYKPDRPTYSIKEAIGSALESSLLTMTEPLIVYSPIEMKEIGNYFTMPNIGLLGLVPVKGESDLERLFAINEEIKNKIIIPKPLDNLTKKTRTEIIEVFRDYKKLYEALKSPVLRCFCHRN